MPEIKSKPYELNVAAANSTVTEEFELDKTAKAVIGIGICASKDSLLFHRGSQKIELNGCELLPEKTASKRLITGTNVEADKRFYTLFGRKEVTNGILKVTYVDVDHEDTTFSAYTVQFYVLYEE